MNDIRMAARALRKSPGATALAVLSMALGIALTTGMFSIADALLLRPFPVARPGELFELASRSDEGRLLRYVWPDFEAMSRAARSRAELAAYQRRGAMLAGEEQTELVLICPATENYFRLLGVEAALGNTALGTTGGRPAAVLGHRLWQRRFGGNPAIAGKTIVLNRQAFTVAGVMPPEFTGLNRGVATDVWVGMEAWFDVLGHRYERQHEGDFEMVARLAPGVNAEPLAAQLDAVIRGSGRHRPAPAGTPGTTLSRRFAPAWRFTLMAGGGLLLVLGLVLFAACANVVQLRLAQGEARKRELAVRMALGAGPWRVARPMLTETALLALAGGALGVLLAPALMRKASEYLSAGRVYLDFGIRLDHRVLLFTVGATLACLLLSGLGPARHAVRVSVAETLKSEQGAAGARTGWAKRALLAGQIAVSVLLFGGAVLFVQSLQNAATVRPGLDPTKKLLVLDVSPAFRTTASWCEQMCERLSGLPGARGATFARRLPLSGSGGGATVRVEAPGQAPLAVHFNSVGSNYFSLMGTRVLAGRGIDATDRAGASLALVASQSFARRFFAGRNPLGEWITVDGKSWQVVGVAEDGPSNWIHEAPEPFLYFAFAQRPWGEATLLVETGGEPAALARAALQELKRADPRATVLSSTTLREHMQRALSTDRMEAAVATLLAIFGMVLTAAGLFGAVHYQVNRRTREFGVRLALGAPRAAIQRMVIGEALRLAAWGIPPGLGLLAGAAVSARSVVLGVTPLDAPAYVLGAAAATLVVLAATWWPARRATRVDPMAALRTE